MPKKISKSDVQIIFDCICQNRLPPTNLAFRIILDTDGLKISPPSYEFENGLYILLRAHNKNNKNCIAKNNITCKLNHLIMNCEPKKGCYWRLSGPQIPSPTRVQQRYCYPKGDKEYSSNRGAMLWTMVNENGEDVEYRLLHVYSSSKKSYPLRNLDAKRVKLDSSSYDSTMHTNKISPANLNPFLKEDGIKINVDVSSTYFFARHLMPKSSQNVYEKQLTLHESPCNYQDSTKNLTRNSNHKEIQDIPKKDCLDFSNNILDSKYSENSLLLMSVPISLDSKKDKKPLPLEHKLEHFSAMLSMFQSELRAYIMKLPPTEQAYSLFLIASWAKSIVKDPVGGQDISSREEKNLFRKNNFTT